MIAPLAARVRLTDTNARGCMDGTRLLVLFEAARADSLRAVGLPYSEILARGLDALTIEARLKNHACAQVDDLLLVEVRATDVGRLRFSFGYEVRRERDDMLVATGETVHICRDSASGQPSRVP